MSDPSIVSAAIHVDPTEPRVLHQGRYRLYEKPDGGLHLVYQRDDINTPDHLELPGAMVKLFNMGLAGNLSPAEMFREAMKLKGNM